MHSISSLRNKGIEIRIVFLSEGVSSRFNINQKNLNKALEYLAIKCSLKPDNTYGIKIVFSGDSVITIISEVI